MRTHQYVTLIIHDLEHFFELTDCGHHLIISGLIGISVKGQGGIHDQGMKKYMGDILKWIFHTGISFFHVGCCCFLHLVTGGKFPVVFQHGDRAGVIILLCQFFGFFEKCFFV